MSTLSAFAAALAAGRIEVVDLTAPLSAQTPVIALPPQFTQTARFELEELSRYDDRGPAWYWNNFRTGEHTGTHFDAPNHWVTGADGEDDFAAIDRGHGFEAATVRGTGDLTAVADWVAGPRSAPLLVDAKVAAGEPSWWLAEAFRGH